jgi:hypothetical protein
MKKESDFTLSVVSHKVLFSEAGHLSWNEAV